MLRFGEGKRVHVFAYPERENRARRLEHVESPEDDGQDKQRRNQGDERGGENAEVEHRNEGARQQKLSNARENDGLQNVLHLARKIDSDWKSPILDTKNYRKFPQFLRGPA